MTNRLTIVADENMPLVDELFGSFSNIIKLPGREISAKHVKHADALLCRSITQVNQALLESSNVQFVGTATIGVDHLDVNWLEQNKIHWSNAAGCNAAAVAQYVISGICWWLKSNQQTSLQNISVGIIGAGHVGTELAKCLDILQVNYQLCDPPLKRQGDQRSLVDFESIMQCDVITFHIPMIKSGVDATYHLVDDAFLSQLTPKQLVINTARGAVIDNLALLDYLEAAHHADFILDVFENEPEINYVLLKKCLLATPHIAGHTLEGKLRGTAMIFQAFSQYFSTQINLPANLLPDIKNIYPAKNQLTYKNKQLDVIDYLLEIYDIHHDSQKLSMVDEQSVAMHFDLLRKNYVASFFERPRRDYSGWNTQQHISKELMALFNASVV